MSSVTSFPRRRIPWAMALSVLSMSAVVRPSDDARARKFIAEHEARIRPLEKQVNLTWWNANVSGKDADFKTKEEAQNKLDEALAEKKPFAELKSIKAARLRDRLLARQIDVLYLMYLEKQVEPALLKKITAKANAIEQAFNVFRAKVNDKAMTDSEVRKVLKESNDSAQRKKVWEAGKAVGSVVDRDLKELVGLRSEAARKLGFRDYHVLQLYLNEQSQEQVLALFDRLDERTREPFRRAKAEIDTRLAQNCGIAIDELRPWHYHDPFFQEPPAVFGADLDAVYAKVDILKLCRDYYAGIGLPIDDVIARSDLYEKPGKSPHAFCTDMDKLWWDLVEKYQRVKRPEGRNAPDYASKIHIVVSPAYYHNYMMGQLFASQVHHTIAREVLKTDPAHSLYAGHKSVGRYMTKRVFAPGKTPWNDLTKFATGEELNPKAFAEDFRGQSTTSGKAGGMKE